MAAGADGGAPGTDADAPLVERAQRGDAAAFEELYRRHVRQVYNLVFRMLHGGQAAEEVTQEVFYQAYKNLASFQFKSRFYTWLYRIGMNVSLQQARRESRRHRETHFNDLLDKGENLPDVQSPADPVKESEDRETYRALEAAIRELPDNQRAVIVLGPIQGHNYEEMSRILGVTTDVIKARLHRARENIRRKVGDLRRSAP